MAGAAGGPSFPGRRASLPGRQASLPGSRVHRRGRRAARCRGLRGKEAERTVGEQPWAPAPPPGAPPVTTRTHVCTGHSQPGLVRVAATS